MTEKRSEGDDGGGAGGVLGGRYGKERRPPPRRPRVTAAALRIVAEDLACARGGRMVFEGISFEIWSGEVLVVTGRNGAGKSSLLRLIAGLVPQAHGLLRLEGGKADTPLAEHIHYVGHLDAVKPALTVEENLSFWAAFHGDGERGVEEALAMMSIDHLGRLPAAYLSAGQRRRLALARLLVSRRPIWLLDEPASALDAAGQADLATLAARHCEAGGLIIAATHADLGFGAHHSLRIGP